MSCRAAEAAVQTGVLDQTRCTARLRFRPVFRFSQVGGGGTITMLTMQVLLIINAKGENPLKRFLVNQIFLYHLCDIS